MRRLGDIASLALQVPVVEQFLKFGLVGLSNTLITFLVFTFLVKALGVWYVAASALGFAAGACNGFLLNRRWTFRGHRGGSTAALRWSVVQGSGLLADLGLIYLLVDGAGIPKLPSQALALALVVSVTFFVNRTWTFRMHLSEQRSPLAPPASAAAIARQPR
jgi:putative flippase GtrA